MLKMYLPDMSLIEKFEKMFQILFEYKNISELSTENLVKLKGLILSRMASKQLEAVV